MPDNIVEIVLRATDRASNVIEQVTNSVSRGETEVASSSERFNQTAVMTDAHLAKLKAAAVAVGGAMTMAAGGVAYVTDKAADFEQELSNIKAVSGATADEMSQLSALAIKAGVDTKYSASEAAQGIEELIKAGVSTTDILNGGLTGALSLASAGELDLADAAEIASTALNAFKNDHLSVAKAADVLSGAANASATSVSELKFSLSAVSSVASSVGLSFEDTATALAVFAQNGLKGQDAGTSLKMMLMNLQPQTDKQRKLFNELNLVTKNGNSVFFDAKGHLKSLADISGILQISMGKLTDAQRLQTMQTIFGTDAIRASNILFKEGAQGVTEMKDAMSNVTAEEVAAEKMNNLRGSIEQLKGSVETVSITLGNKAIPAVRATVDAATSAVNGFETWLTSSDTLGEAFKKLENKEYDTARQARELTQEYEKLKAKTSPTADEQKRMNDILDQIGQLMPDVVKRYSEYGDVLEIDTKKLAENIDVGEKHVTILEKIGKVIKDQVAPAYGIMAKMQFGGYGMEQVNAKTFEEAEAVVKNNLAVISDDIQHAEERWQELHFNSREAYLEYLNRSYRTELQKLQDFEQQRLDEIKKNTDEEYQRQKEHYQLMKTADGTYLANKEAMEKAYRDRGAGSLKVHMAELESITIIGTDNAAAAAEKHLTNLENAFKRGGENSSNNFKTGIDTGLTAASEKVLEHKEQIMDTLGDTSRAYSGGKNVGDAWGDGLSDALQRAYSTSAAQLQRIEAQMYGNSPPKEGPLRHIDKGGFNIGVAWAESFGAGLGRASSIADKALSLIGSRLSVPGGSNSALTPALRPALSGNTQNTYYVNINPRDIDQMNKIIDLFDKLQQAARARG